jgi:hypothetical protein
LVKNALKLAYVYLSVQNNFPGLYAGYPILKKIGGRHKGRWDYRKNGRKGMGRKEG